MALACSNSRNQIVMPMLLAVDAGGTSTRAVLLDSTGRSLGYGRAGSGNPTAVGIPLAVGAIAEASEQALAGGGGAGSGPPLAAIAMAGEQSPVFVEHVSARLATLGVGRVLLQPDLLGIFHSGTHERDGYALIGGTGTVAARVHDGRLDRVVGGRGWLLGDAGGGFWIGHHVVRAVVAALDGQGPPTTLTDLVLRFLDIPADPGSPPDRVRFLGRVVSALYARPPVQLSAFAPLAFAAADDPVARQILAEASTALVDLLSAVRVPHLSGPVVLGGSVLVHGLLAGSPELLDRLVPPAGDVSVVSVADGVVGAAVLGLRNADVEVDAQMFHRIRSEVAGAVARFSDPPCPPGART